MSALIDVDQLRTFIAIAETGSFTNAAEVVHKTQSAVSMQMKRLEERLGKPIFARDGRASKLTEDGERLLDYARRIVKLNVEALAAFDDDELSRPRAARRAGRLRRPLSAGDHGAVLARLSERRADRDLRAVGRSLERIDANEIDLAIVTDCEHPRASETFRRERLLWVTSNRHSIHTRRAAAARARPADLRLAARRDRAPRDDRRGRYRILYSSANAGAVAAAVLAGLAVSVLAGIGLAARHARAHPADGFPNCRPAASAWCAIRTRASALADALAEHIISSLDNLSEAAQAAE